ncbi:pentatricopeptide repeat-containing protein At3g53700, chloroplastic [Spinacia oleracea]|uniref:Pentatricopeptide repeat-containing protein At3g53700, chloroplastic n=1 Tax=Spinacia oleracea TaxID=3562 RepID=A0ABM3RN93_SPIOL|nr:pentatricopeptide repeat-containing protein At3g53700, chloroplastic-like [Spinacia oleracea]
MFPHEQKVKTKTKTKIIILFGRTSVSELSHFDLFKYFEWALSRDDFEISDLLLDGITYIPKPWHCESEKRWLDLSWNLVKSNFDTLICHSRSCSGRGGVITKLRNKLIENLGEEKRNSNSNSLGIVTTRILNKLINAFGYYEDDKSGIEILNKFPDFKCFPDLNSYSNVVFCARGSQSEAWELQMFQNIVNRLHYGIQRDSVDDESVYWIIDMYCKLDKPKLAHAIYEAAKEKTPPKSVHQLIHCLSKHDETLCLAVDMLAGLSTSANATSAFSSVILGLCRKGHIEEAMQIAMGMLLEDQSPEFQAFYHLIISLCTAGNMEDALALLELREEQSGGLNPAAYRLIVSGYGRMEQANQMATSSSFLSI